MDQIGFFVFDHLSLGDPRLFYVKVALSNELFLFGLRHALKLDQLPRLPLALCLGVLFSLRADVFLIRALIVLGDSFNHACSENLNLKTNYRLKSKFKY